MEALQPMKAATTEISAECITDGGIEGGKPGTIVLLSTLLFMVEYSDWFYYIRDILISALINTSGTKAYRYTAHLRFLETSKAIHSLFHYMK